MGRFESSIQFFYPRVTVTGRRPRPFHVCTHKCAYGSGDISRARANRTRLYGNTVLFLVPLPFAKLGNIPNGLCSGHTSHRGLNPQEPLYSRTSHSESFPN
jgi:hypothetical protein